MPPLERDRRAPHDQIIDHDLHLVSTDKMPALIVIELRRLRQQIADLHETLKGDKDAPVS